MHTGAFRDQKRVTDHVELSYKQGATWLWWWEENLGPLEEKYVLFTTEPSLQPQDPMILHFKSL